MKKNTEIKLQTIISFWMKLNRPLLILFAIAGMIPPLVFRAIDWYQGKLLSNWDAFSLNVLISVLTTVTISCGVVSILMWLQKKHPWRAGIAKRLFLEIVLTTLTACSLIVLLTIVMLPIAPKADLQGAIFNYLIVAMIMNFVLVAITEGVFFFKQWKNSAVEAERFKKEIILAKFESLKNQVNPHFLFNSLNTLSSLIDHDKDLSKEFLYDLSSVYRYVLQHKDDEVVPIKTEMEFIQAYTQLLKKRHGERVAFQLNIPPSDLLKGIPPMSLQLLVENAVKHNIASRKKPLKVEIFSQDDYLVVRNNLQKKKAVKSTGVGLKNIQNRYQYLSNECIAISENEFFFEVKIPTINLEGI